MPAMRTFFAILVLCLLSVGVRADQIFRDGDIFTLAVGGAPREYTQDFELQYTVDGGMVTVPMIGRIRAAGLSPSQVAATIEKRLRDEKIFTNPSVVINAKAPDRIIMVGGAVRNPGRHPWSQGMTLTRAIATASGPSEWATDQVKVIRGGRAEVFSRKAIKKNPALDPQIGDGDFVEVQGDF
jgi:polysaccharide biosynthesis/export protein